MLIVVDKERGCDAALVRPPRQSVPRPRPPAPPRHTRLWVFTMVLTLVASAVGMSRIGIDLTFGLWPGGRDKPVTLDRQLPYGKGMWIWQVNQTESGDAKKIVGKAKAVGLTHLYVRMGSSWDGFYAAPFLNEILPVAHEAGIRVYGWDFPRLIDPAADVARAVLAITYATPDGHLIDGFAPDIETRSEGTHITAEAAIAYGEGLRAAAGEGYPLIAVVPRPSPWTMSFFPYGEVVAKFDAIAPMVYWLNREPGPDVQGALRDLAPLGKPVFPVGQAYDGAPEGGRHGVPPRAELLSFAEVAHLNGAEGISFWSWQAANEQAWEAIRDAPWFKLGKPRLAEIVTEAIELPENPAAIRRPVVLQAG